MSEFLSLGAVQGMRFDHELLLEVAQKLEKGDSKWVIEKAIVAERPHGIVSNAGESLSASEFRHRLYREGLIKRIKREWREIRVAFREVLDLWWEKIECAEAGSLTLDACCLYAALLEENEPPVIKLAKVKTEVSRKLHDCGRSREALIWLEDAYNLLIGGAGRDALYLNQYKEEPRHEVLEWSECPFNGIPAGQRRETLKLANQCIDMFHILGETKRALSSAEMLCKICDVNLGGWDSVTLDALNSLGSIYLGMQDSLLAENSILEALDGRVQTLGLEHPDTLSSLHQLGSLLNSRDKSRGKKQAEEKATAALKAEEERERITVEVHGGYEFTKYHGKSTLTPGGYRRRKANSYQYQFSWK